jgi:Ca-activated chloride channel family protein
MMGFSFFKFVILFMRRLFVFFFIACPLPLHAQAQCSVEIVLALDVSGSVDLKEFTLQKHGVSDAFRDVEVQELIEFLPGGITAAITHWSGHGNQEVIVNLQRIRNASEANAFAQKLLDYTRVRSGALTAIGSALLHADNLLNSSPTPCHRRVIDVSSDGRNNRGPDPTLIAEKLAENGTTINALVISNADGTLLPYFRQNIVRGAGAFAQSAHGYKDYARAIKEKLLRELAPAVSEFDYPRDRDSQFAQNEWQ